MRILTVFHDPLVPAGRFATEASAAGHELLEVHLEAGDELPDRSAFDAVVVLGGTMGAYDIDLYPFLIREKEFLASTTRAGVPVLGICLGGQLLADALGGRVFLADRPEVAFKRLEVLVPDDALAAALGSGRVVTFHQDTWDPPPGSTLTCVSDRFDQMFRYRNAVAVQAHPEVTQEDLTAWIVEAGHNGLMARAGVAVDPLAQEVVSAADEIEEVARRFFSAWFAEAEALVSGERSVPGCGAVDIRS